MIKNSSSSLLNTSTSPTIHVILNIISLTATTMGTLLSFVILVGVLLRRKTVHDVQLLLCTNNYILVFFLGIVELIHNMNTLRGDFGYLVMDEETVECRIQAYILFSIGSAVYLACILQAVFRLCRIVHPTILWLLNAHTYLIIIPLMWITSFVLVSPLYIWHGQTLILGEYTCRVPKDDAFSVAYSTMIVHGLPFLCLGFIYFQVHRFLRRQAASSRFDLASRSRRRKRDLLVFRRIVIIVILLGSYGTPNATMLIILAITGKLVPSFYRILDLSFAAGVLTLSMKFFYVTPHLRKKVRIWPRKTRGRAVVIKKSKLKRQRFDPNQLKMKTQGL